MLKQLFRPTPKWQSPKSQRRIEAIAEFMPEQSRDLDILVRMAREDSEPAVRREAVKKLHDLDLILQIQRKDLEATVREAASTRFNELLAGKSPHSPSISERIRRIGQINTMQTLGYLIKEAQPIDIKIAAVEQISDEILLEGIALKSSIARLRQLAAERISNPRVLESLANQSRHGDKSVYRIVRDKLDALHSLEKSRQHSQGRLLALCESMEAHARSALNPLFAAKTESLLQQWAEVTGEAGAELAERFDTARDMALQISEAQRLEEQQRRENAQAAAEQIASCEALESALGELSANPDSFDQPALAALVKTQGLRWQIAIEQCTPQNAVLQRYTAAMARLQEAQALMEAVQSQRELIESSIQTAQDGTQADPTGNTLAPLSDIVEKLPASQGLPLPSILKMAYKLLEKQGQDQEHEQQAAHAEKAEHRRQLGTLLDVLEAAVQAGNSKLAGKKLREAQQLTRQHHLHDHRLPELMHRVQELRDWAGYAILPKKQALLEDMTTLAERDMDPDSKADAIKALQENWKALGVSDPHVENPLWEQFKAASDRAYEPCKVHFAAQREIHQQHALKREEICKELEGYLAALSETPSIKHLDTLIRAARQEWQRYFPVERHQAQALQQRFNKIMKQLDSLLKTAQQGSESRKQALIDEARALLDSPDNRAACNRIKEMQQLWKQIEPARHKTDQQLWKEFRGFCDQVFARRDTEIQHRKAAGAASLEQAEALIATQQQLAEAALQGARDDAESAALGERFRTLELPREQRQSLQKRFDQALRQRELNARQAQQAARHAAQQHFIEMFTRCASADTHMRQQQAVDVVALQQAAAALTIPEPWQSLLRQRLDRLMTASSDSAAREQWLRDCEEQTTLCTQLCLEIEILLDQPSPAAWREARLQKQMEMLQENAFHRRSNSPEQKAREKLQAMLGMSMPDDLMPRVDTLLKTGKIVL